MRIFVFRVLGGGLGLSSALAAILGPFLFISNELQEAQSAHRYGGHMSVLGAVGGSLLVLALAGFFVVIAYIFLRFALRGPKQS
jgi:hypothetical protein